MAATLSEIKQRIAEINRVGGMAGISGVFYALGEGRISPGKAMECVRHFLLTGNVDRYTAPIGEELWEETVKYLIAKWRERTNGYDPGTALHRDGEAEALLECAEELEELLRKY